MLTWRDDLAAVVCVNCQEVVSTDQRYYIQNTAKLRHTCQKSIDEIQQVPMDGYQVANQMRGLKLGDEGYNDSWLATEAYREMKQAGWKFSAYHFDFGTEIWAPPSWKTCKDTSALV